MRSRLSLSATTVFLAVLSLSSALLAQGSGSSHQLIVLRAQVDLVNDVVLLEGQNFITAGDPTAAVTLSGFPMPVVGTPTASELYFSVPDGMAPGTYLVQVSRGSGTPQNDVFAVTIGNAGATFGIQATGGADEVMVGYHSALLDDNTAPQYMSFRPRQ